MAKYKMILDLDTGIDDALAIAYALATPKADLIGIIGSYGNVVTSRGVQNSLDLLELLGHPEVPVYMGAKHSSTTDHFDVMPVSAQIHGVNGVGEVELKKADQQVATEDGVDFLISAAHKYQKDLLLVPTGPLTNLAAALDKDPEIADLIGSVSLMGGALTVPGNVTPVTEANINQDPKAADRVFRSSLPLTMVGLDVTTRTLLTIKETQQWRDLGTTAGQKYADIVDFYIDAYKVTSPHLGGCALHDPLAVAVAVEPDLVSTIFLNMKVDTKAPFAGRTIGDETRINEPATQTQVAVNVDKDRFVSEFMTKLTDLFKNN
ncbi:nucleoside hydrolase [Ligilactobacillus pobuzihii]|uniref:Inosine-uridine preferring nucleoside hydrolase n=1 Tax=Ligilactobacillus pobuzihii TaxID=449659 RepID=A0A0R2LLQ3_9LACO|nr:nucleoside hydrolase [Ligilactobacillus pobuzihii]KRK11378.1 inosine-uridine preferring nucleoside hydrolase [Ligilactobacillus pobuzihii E100301 = KCTC 13174]KRO02693.1 inosine-uridine preferring nucleoside hydrolase [Ligilactobacillus pobuzihii]GEN47355.1 inosine-uridine nucleoside N-ribohydrolase [Ligilactobacillus pobuzihii]